VASPHEPDCASIVVVESLQSFGKSRDRVRDFSQVDSSRVALCTSVMQEAMDDNLNFLNKNLSHVPTADEIVRTLLATFFSNEANDAPARHQYFRCDLVDSLDRSRGGRRRVPGHPHRATHISVPLLS
jgi:hypothetical protein